MFLMRRKESRLPQKALFPLFFIQVAILVGIFLSSRTSYLWFWAVISFIPALIICLFSSKRFVLVSLFVLFISQQAIIFSANPSWGIAFGSDPINDFHTASVMSESAHFSLGSLGYTQRTSYSYYPILHLFSVIFASLSGFSLIYVALYLVPILNAFLTTFSLYKLNYELFGLEGTVRNLATLLFEMSFYYSLFDSQFVREAFAFPIVLLALWILVRSAKKPSNAYSAIAVLLIGVIVLSHQVSSYVFFLLLALLTICFNVFHHNNRLNRMLLLAGVLIGAYTSFVALAFSASTLTYVFQGLEAIFVRGGSYTILKTYSASSLYLSYAYYVVLSISVAIGGLKIMRTKKKNWVSFTMLGFFTFAFVLCVLLRLSTSADPWSYTYYSALRGTIWAFIGISVLAAMGLVSITRMPFFKGKGFLVLVLIVCILAAGKISQYPTFITDSSTLPLTHPGYIAALWLRSTTTHGENMLVADYRVDNNAFESSRSMAPYAYLKEYFLDESKGVTFANFNGYVPFVAGYFDQYRNSTRIQIIYSNGNVEIGKTS